MTTYRCLVVDDEPIARKGLIEFIDRMPDLEFVAEARNALEAREILDREEVDILFLDIQMPRISGIDMLKGQVEVPAVVITSAYSQYAIDGFELEVQDYLLKPIAYPRFCRAAAKAIEYIELKRGFRQRMTREARHIFIRTEGTLHKIELSNLLFVKAMQNYMICHTRQGKLITHITMKSLEEQLPEQSFARIHKSFLVNIPNIERIEGNEVELGGFKLPISRNFKEEAYRKILKDQLISR